MSRLGTANQAQAQASHRREIAMAKIEFSTPVYVHSGMGNVTYDGNTYLGVGSYGSSDVSESENLGPAPIRLQLSAVDTALVTEALDSGNFGDAVTLYVGYLDDAGALIADPWIAAKGTLDHMVFTRGDDNVITLVAQNELASLDTIAGDKFSTEDQEEKFTGDVGLEFATDQNFSTLRWGGRNPTVGRHRDEDRGRVRPL